MKRLGAVFLIASSAIGCSTKSEDLAARTANARSSEDSLAAAGIATALAKHVAALRAGDVKAANDVFTDDVVVAEARTTLLQGRAAMDSDVIANMSKAELWDLHHETHTVRRVGNVAYELGTVLGTYKAKGQPEMKINTSYMASWRRQPDSTWRMQQFIMANP